METKEMTNNLLNWLNNNHEGRYHEKFYILNVVNIQPAGVSFLDDRTKKVEQDLSIFLNLKDANSKK